MATTTPKSARTGARRIWKAPTSRTRWLWLAASGIFYIAIVAWYIQAHRTQQYVGPINDPLRLFGIFSYIMVLGTLAYTLRRRFVRGLPGKVQGWLWMHTWVGIGTILIAMLHEDFASVTHDYCTNLTCLTDTYWAFSALLGLFVLVLSGIIGRLVDRWQTHVISTEASSNGVGISQALQERVVELEYIVERLCAGKSAAFKDFCLRLLRSNEPQWPSRDPATLPPIVQSEHPDFRQAFETLEERAALLQSWHRQKRAQHIMKVWRNVHMILATVSLLVISYHAVMELLVNVFHVLPGA